MPSHSHWAWWDDAHWHWSDWDWDAAAPWRWGGDLGCTHLSCALRRTRWPRHCWALGSSATDLTVCGRDALWPAAHWHHASGPWCDHRACLSGAVTIETGEEPGSLGKGTFKVVLDVHHFRPDELELRVRNRDTLVLRGRQKEDRARLGPGCVAREFTRRYRLPRHYDATQATATRSTDGVLTILVPTPPPLDDVERVLEIGQTGVYYGSEANALEAGAEDSTKEPAKESAKEGAEEPSP